VSLAAALVCASAVSAADHDVPRGPLNRLTRAQKAHGWHLLFDGRSLNGWHRFKRQEPPGPGWIVEGGILKKRAGVSGGDLLSDDTYAEFELEWDWRLPPGANNGVKYFVLESRSQPLGHEYQMIDDAIVSEAKGKTASFYDVLPTRQHRALKPPGQWNHSRIVVEGAHVEHWLNGERVLAYELGSPEVLAAVGKSKFKAVPGFGGPSSGSIMLTDHRDEAWFCNVKIRPRPGATR
jgi:hypothetical protein